MQREDERELVVHDQQTGFHQPDGDELHLFHHEYHLGAEYPFIDLFGCHYKTLVIWVDEIAARLRNNSHANHENGIGGLKG